MVDTDRESGTDNMLPDALRESMAGAGVADDEHDGVESDSLTDASEARLAPLASKNAPPDQFPDNDDPNIEWQDSAETQPRRGSALKAVTAASAASASGAANRTGQGGIKGAFYASIGYLVLIAGVIAYLAFLAPPPPPPAPTVVAATAAITGDDAMAEPAPTPDTGPDMATGHQGQAMPDGGETGHRTDEPGDTAATTPSMEHQSADQQPVQVAVMTGPKRPPDQAPMAPIKTLLESSEFGPLPIIAANGNSPFRAYSRTVPILDNPRIAIVMTDLGLEDSRTRIAIEQLPPEISLAFYPYAEDLQHGIDMARDAGHESLLEIPMEPLSYPHDDPGPHALLIDATREENLENLHRSLATATGYVGVTNFMGSAFMTNRAVFAPVLADIAQRGLMFVDSNASARSLTEDLAERLPLPFNRSQRLIDASPSIADIDEQLASLEGLAKANGTATGFAQPYPLTFQRLQAWIPLLKSRGIDLVPVSSLAKRATPTGKS